MKRIAIFCVIYNSYGEFQSYMRSVSKAVLRAEDTTVDVFVVDNTTDNIQEISTSYAGLNIMTKQNKKNLGYFGGIQSVMKQVDCTTYDYIIVSNVDVEMELDTLSILINKPVNKNVGWIAPQIFSLKEQRDRNPKILHRYSMRKLQLLRLMYKFPILHTIYNLTLYKRKHIASHTAGLIYGGHGSFIILTKRYFEECGTLDYPIFLFDEEIYLAEKCRESKLLVEYDPSIKVKDIDHASTSKMKSHFYNKCNIEALDYIMEKFY